MRDALDTDSDSDGLPDGFIDGANGQPADGARQKAEGEDFDLNGRVAGDDDGSAGSTAWNRLWELGESWKETDPLNKDTDGDSLDDGWEVSEGFDPLNPNGDFDGDGLSDVSEMKKYGTNPKNKDTDDDNWWDGAEVLGTIPGPYPGGPGSFQTCNPLLKDSDADGLSDWEEGNLNGGAGYQNDGFTTFCWDPDTDDGGVSDYDEAMLIKMGWGFNPQNGLDDLRDSDSDGITDARELLDPKNTCLNPVKADSDGDLVKDGDELAKGLDPCDEDTDNDLIGDGDELLFVGSDPLKPDTDGDGLTDGQEVFTYGTDPANKDTDGDGLDDKYEIDHGMNPNDPKGDADNDGLSDADEINKYKTDPTKKDTDGDGLSDGFEVTNGLDPLNAKGDRDKDGLTDADEFFKYGTYFDLADSDGDGINDGVEIANGTDPLNPNDPGAPLCGMWDVVPDGIIDLQDINAVLFNSIFYNAAYNAKYDIVKDGVVDIADVFAVAVHFGETCP